MPGVLVSVPRSLVLLLACAALLQLHTPLRCFLVPLKRSQGPSQLPEFVALDVAQADDSSTALSPAAAAEEGFRRAEAVINAEVATALYRGDTLGGLTLLRDVVNPSWISAMRQEAELLLAQGRLTRTGDPNDRPPDPQWEKYFGKVPTLTILGHDEAKIQGWPGLAFGTAFLCGICAALTKHRPEGGGIDPLQPGTLQLACYDGGGASYQLHSDGALESDLDEDEMEIAAQHRTAVARRVTAILYLQEPGWDPAWGGAFRAHHYDPKAPEETLEPVDVQPEGGSLLLFRSRDLAHEVLQTYNRRFALSMWCHVDPDHL